MLSSRSKPLETAVALPVGDRRLEGVYLDAGPVEVVVDDLGAERLWRHRAGGEGLLNVVDVVRDARLVGFAGVPLEARLHLQLVVSRQQAGGYRRAQRQV